MTFQETTPADASTDMAALIASEGFRHAVATMDREHERTVQDIVTLTEIPSPPFGEEARGRAYLDMLRAHGLEEVETDAVGNVMGLRRGAGNGSIVVVSAHMDTVFPAGTDVTVRREGTRLYAPGVGDDTRSLAVLLAFIRALDAAGIRTRHDLLFVGGVGEEGKGDLRGMRHLFHEGRHRKRIKAFFTVDSPGMGKLVTGGVGSKRYRTAFRGPGGHSFQAFGLVNPAFALARAAAALGAVEVPLEPKTTFSVSVLGGGTSINSIPNEVWMEVDLRSESPAELARLDARFHEILAEAVSAENAARSTETGAVSVEAKLVGDRPAGETSADSAIVRYAGASLAAHGIAFELSFSSTDANIAMSLGIPAAKIGSGGTGGRNHSPEEWIDVEKGESLKGMSAGLAAILAVAGMEAG